VEERGMSTAHATAGGISWRRYTVVAVGGLAVATTMIFAVGQGALAASFAVSGTSFKLSADKLEGTGFASYTTIDATADGTNHPVTPAGFSTAKLTNLCQSVVSTTPLGPVTMRLTAGGTAPVEATNLVADFDNLQGDIVFSDYASGVDASNLSGGTSGPAGEWGQQAAGITIDNLRQNTWATTAGTFTLKGLNIDVAFGRNECY
jgi:Family of unknown function (DUF6230)